MEATTLLPFPRVIFESALLFSGNPELGRKCSKGVNIPERLTLPAGYGRPSLNWLNINAVGFCERVLIELYVQ